jgi:hypothetical protein
VYWVVISMWLLAMLWTPAARKELAAEGVIEG